MIPAMNQNSPPTDDRALYYWGPGAKFMVSASGRPVRVMAEGEAVVELTPEVGDVVVKIAGTGRVLSPDDFAAEFAVLTGQPNACVSRARLAAIAVGRDMAILEDTGEIVSLADFLENAVRALPDGTAICRVTLPIDAQAHAVDACGSAGVAHAAALEEEYGRQVQDLQRIISDPEAARALRAYAMLRDNEPEPATTVLWRCETAAAPGRRPDFDPDNWIHQGLVSSGAWDAMGRWFTDDRDNLDFYALDCDGEFRIVRLEVPRETAGSWALERQEAPSRFSRDPDSEYFVSREAAESAVRDEATEALVRERISGLDRSVSRYGRASG